MMKRCPECGFRADDRICPLCGVRMRDLPGAAKSLQTHVHQQSGEACALPNRERRKTMIPPTAGKRSARQSAKPGAAKVLPTILVVVIALLFRACAA